MISRLHLKNFKCFEDQDLALRPLTLLSGVNGTGKSSVFQSLLLLRQSFLEGFLPGRGLALNGDLVQIGTGRDALYEDAHDPTIGFTLQLADGRTTTWAFDYSRAADVLKNSSSSPTPEVAGFYDSSLFSQDFHYLGAERIGPRPSFEMADHAVRDLRQLGPRGQYTAHFLAVYGKETLPSMVVAHPQAASSGLQDQVEAWLRTLIPGTRLHLTPYRAMDLVVLEYAFVAGSDVSNAYRPTNVGFGITCVLPILVAALASRPGTLLLVENPEAHLHPRGQARIGNLLARAAQAGVQVLIETHSDHVLNGLRLALHAGEIATEQVQLHFFERRIAQGRAHHTVVSPRLDADGRIDHWPEGFFDEWDRSLEALLAPRQEAP